jgi:hypothetical protein
MSDRPPHRTNLSVDTLASSFVSMIDVGRTV